MNWLRLSTIKTSKVYYFLFNKHCYLCDALSTQYLCDYCHPYIALNHHSCRLCARPSGRSQILCGECQKTQPQQHVCIAPMLYQTLTAHLIKAIKFQQQSYYGHILTDILSQSLKQHYQADDWPDEIIPVPSHARRVRERGFCQTTLLAKMLAASLSPTIKVNSRSFIKHRYTAAQHQLNKHARHSAQKHAFKVIGPIARHVALFDDVITTGSTTQACINTLIKHGVERVDIWALARTP